MDIHRRENPEKCLIWGSLSGAHEAHYLLGCDTPQFARHSPTFRRNCYSLPARFLLEVFFNTKNGGRTYIRNVGKLLTAHSTIQHSPSSKLFTNRIKSDKTGRWISSLKKFVIFLRYSQKLCIITGDDRFLQYLSQSPTHSLSPTLFLLRNLRYKKAKLSLRLVITNHSMKPYVRVTVRNAGNI
jgi:hypothetical protein